MNIFILDNCPIKSAKWQVDRHVVKMILETAQLLCSIFEPNTAPYKRTHYNHPCSIWARESYDNYKWLLTHGLALCDEYTNRYSKHHKSKEIIIWCANNVKPEMFSKSEKTEHPKCMPDYCKVDDAVMSYRNYYRTHKRHIATWKQNRPEWY